ncbi:ATPase, T2SS/T4P/T4SS family [Microbulbifer bruguierae]|uniref:ATPase, T2SS/T4P/T4SS family n=1 Tax=Microbulbifer bruguierae TaxID=3029061 RepID=A0ABY8N928_9GAMM|nr:ATPase, T2SS/T4P/T4SS family [Microbulbifer bruguierae]WGL15421.1 ATPase, T2SS/T4P/T4SS family [Microbulbifer bruguierae]
MKIIVETRKGTLVGRYHSERDRFIIGKGKEALIDLAGWRIAKQHAVVSTTDNRIFIEAADKRAEVQVNNTRINQKYGPLKDGEKISIGDYLVTIEDSRLLGNNPISQPDQTCNTDESIPHVINSSSPATNQAQPLSTPLNLEVVALAREWKLKLHAGLIKTMDLRRTNISNLSVDELRDLSAGILKEVLDTEHEFPAEKLDRGDILKQVLEEAVGLGPLEDLLADPDISEVMVNAYDEIYFEKSGTLQKSEICFSDDRAVLSAIDRIVSPLGRRIDESSPMVDARLRDGSRVNAIIPPLAIRGPSITIRKFMQEKLTMEHLKNFGSVNRAMIDFLEMAVTQHLNIIISGGTGSGKTTLLNALSNFIPDDERIITVEDAAELKLNKPHVVSLEARPPNQEGSGAVTIRDLVKNCLRMRPDRIVVGECRSGEALDMLQAMNTGHDGSLTTVHSNSPRDCISRLEVLVMMSGMDLPVTAIREQIASAVHLVVQQSRFACGARKITSISEITGVEGTTVQISEIFRYQELGFDANGKTKGYFEATGNVPEFYEKLATRGIPVDMSIFRVQERTL